MSDARTTHAHGVWGIGLWLAGRQPQRPTRARSCSENATIERGAIDLR